jgi:hypothetical protein
MALPLPVELAPLAASAAGLPGSAAGMGAAGGTVASGVTGNAAGGVAGGLAGMGAAAGDMPGGATRVPDGAAGGVAGSLAGVGGGAGEPVWPEADEDALQAAALRWLGLAAELRAAATGSAAEIGRLLAAHSGGDLDAFAARWADGPARQLVDTALAAEGLAAGLATMAAVVLELKAFVVGRLAVLAARLAGLEHAEPRAAAIAAQAAAVAATGAALRQAWANATGVIENGVVPVLRAAEARLPAAHPGGR